MIHNMKINDSAFQRMNNGTKVREYRINNEKRRKVKIGDIIEFHKISNPKDIIEMKVNDIKTYKTIKDAIKEYFDKDFSSRHKDIDSTVQSFYDKGFVTKEEEEKYGMVIFHIGKIKQKLLDK